jgi:hypothetical protein
MKAFCRIRDDEIPFLKELAMRVILKSVEDRRRLEKNEHFYYHDVRTNTVSLVAVVSEASGLVTAKPLDDRLKYSLRFSDTIEMLRRELLEIAEVSYDD